MKITHDEYYVRFLDKSFLHLNKDYGDQDDDGEYRLLFKVNASSEDIGLETTRHDNHVKIELSFYRAYDYLSRSDSETVKKIMYMDFDNFTIPRYKSKQLVWSKLNSEWQTTKIWCPIFDGNRLNISPSGYLVTDYLEGEPIMELPKFYADQIFDSFDSMMQFRFGNNPTKKTVEEELHSEHKKIDSSYKRENMQKRERGNLDRETTEYIDKLEEFLRKSYA